MGRLFPFQSLLYVSPYTYGALIFIFQRHPRYVNPYRALIQPLTMGRFYPFSSATVCQSLYLWGYYFLFLHFAVRQFPIPTGRLFSFSRPIVLHWQNLF